MKKQNGITLIALVISIIIMLILAGVSINAVVGDNGILSKAQEAKTLQGCVVLEEYFQDLYAGITIDNKGVTQAPLETIMYAGYQECFFKTSEGYCLKKVVTNAEGLSQTLVLYLLKKEQLPEEIRNQIGGQDNLESRDYRKLKGVYGITSDLKVYYCQDGLESIIGLEVSDLNADSPEIVAFEKESVLAQMINGGTEVVSNQDLKSIKILTIDNISELEVLKNFDEFINLTTVYFKNITIPTLTGIEGAVEKLNYVKFTNCNVQDYSALNGLSNLMYLYLVTPVGKNAEVVTLCSADKGIASAEFSKLQYFGIVGNDTYVQTTGTNYSTAQYDITDVSALSNLSDTTKKAIKHMYLQNLQLTSIASLENFINVQVIRLEYNALTTLEGIQNMSNLKYLIAPYLSSKTTKLATLGTNEGDASSTTDALSYIYKNNNVNSSLYHVDLKFNSNMKYINYLSECSGIKYLYLEGCTALVDSNTLGTVIGNCGTNYSIDGKYGLGLISNSSKCLSLSGTMTVSEFEQLKNNTNLTHLSLKDLILKDTSNVTLTATTTPTFNEEVNNVLSTCTNLKYLQLNNLTNLTTIDFVDSGKCVNLIELDLLGSGVTDLTNLNTYGTKIRTLAINNKNIDITTIQATMNRCTYTKQYWLGNQYGILLFSWDLLKQLENCTELENFYVYAGNLLNYSNGKTLDLSRTNIKKFKVFRIWSNITFPTSIEYVYLDQAKYLPTFLAGSDNMRELHIVYNFANHTEAQWNTFMPNVALLSNLEYFRIGMDPAFKFSHLEYLKDLTNLKTFVYDTSWNWGDYDIDKVDLNGIGNLKYATNIQILNLKYLYDISDIANCTSLQNLTISNSAVSNISSVSGLTNLTKLDLNNNAINDVYPLRNLTKLKELNLKNNVLSDFSSSTNENGNVVNYETMDIFYDLNHEKQGALEKLNISGNNYDDAEILLDLTWTEKIGF